MRQVLALGLSLGLLAQGALLGLGWVAQHKAERWTQASRWRVRVAQAPAPLKRIRVARLPKGSVIVLDEGQAELWRVLVKVQGAGVGESVAVIKRLRKLRGGHLGQALVGISDTPAPITLGDVMLARPARLFETTAYDPGPVSNSRGWVGTTATGARARFGVVAVDTKVIAFGTRLYVEGYGPAIAADRGGAIKGARLDLCFNSTREARAWGRRKKTRVWVLDSLPKARRQALQRRLEAQP